jgi:hypothetical protein
MHRGMDPENTRSRPPSGLFSDETSPSPTDSRRSVSDAHPYRGTRDSLVARREALEKELASVDAKLQQEAAAAAATPARSSGLAELGSIFLPRRAMSVVMAGMLAGVGVSSLLAYQLGAGFSDADLASHVVVDRSHRFSPHTQDESAREHSLRRRKEGEALLMSSFFAPATRPPEALPRIARVGPTTWEVDESILEQRHSPYTSLRMLPHVSRTGRVDGIRLFGIRPDGIQTQLGLRNGDVVMRANGFEMSGADGAFAAVESMRRTHYLTVEIQRDGGTVVQHYLITHR